MAMTAMAEEAPRQKEPRREDDSTLHSEEYWAAKLGVHRDSVRKARAAGQLGYYRVHSRILISGKQIAEFLREREVRRAKAGRR